jgi:hypothetical protein
MRLLAMKSPFVVGWLVNVHAEQRWQAGWGPGCRRLHTSFDLYTDFVQILGGPLAGALPLPRRAWWR